MVSVPNDAIHFGWYVRWRRIAKGLSLNEAGAIAGIGEKRMWEIEQTATPDVQPETYGGIARMLGMEPQALAAWEKTPVPEPPKKRSGRVPNGRMMRPKASEEIDISALPEAEKRKLVARLTKKPVITQKRKP